MAKSVDLRKMVMAINEQKSLNAGLSLEFDCMLEVEDHTNLVKSINYIINYCTELSDQALYISLNDQMQEFLLNISVKTVKTEFPPLSPQLSDLLKEYDAKVELRSEPGKFVQVITTFM